jgi:ABC-type transporter Mla MlaB component
MTVKFENNVVQLAGRIDFANVVFSTKAGMGYFDKMAQISVDLKGLEQGDSSALALISAWIRCAKQLKKEIWFTNMPAFLQNLAKVSGVEALIPIR